MEARRNSSGNLTKGTSLSSRRNDQPVVLLLRETALLHQADTRVHVVERGPLPRDPRIGRLVMTIGGGTETVIGSRARIGRMSTEGTGTAIEGRIRIGAAGGGGVEMKMGGGTKTEVVITAIAIQTNEIAQETDARGVVTRGIKHPCVKVNTLSCCVECTYVSSSCKRCWDSECWLRMQTFASVLPGGGLLPWTGDLCGVSPTPLVTVKDLTSLPKMTGLET